MMPINTRGTDGGISAEIRESEKCFLCSSRNIVGGLGALGPYRGRGAEARPERREGHSFALDANLWTTLILRKLLDLSMEECQEVFEIGGAGGYPEVKVCGDCAQFIQQFRKGHALLLEIEREVRLMKEAARERILDFDNRLENEEGVPSGSVRERVRMYFQDAVGVQTASDQLPSSVQAAGRASASLTLESELGYEQNQISRKNGVIHPRSEADSPVGEQSAYESQIVAAVVESGNVESPHSSLAGVEVTAAARSEIELGPTPAAAVELPCGEEIGNESTVGPEPLASSSKGTQEKERVRKATMTRKATGNSRSESIQEGLSGTARRKSFQRRDRHTQLPHVRGQTKSVTCLFCGKGFLGRCSNLIRHTRVHTREKPYFCKVCSKEFSQSSDLNLHVRSLHTNIRPYKCELCGKGFTNLSNLTIHMRVHTKELPYKCELCSKGFSQSSHLTSHMRVHTGEKPYNCPHCNKWFSYSGGLKHHLERKNKACKELA